MRAPSPLSAGLDINATDAGFAAHIYPKPAIKVPSLPPPHMSSISNMSRPTPDATLFAAWEPGRALIELFTGDLWHEPRRTTVTLEVPAAGGPGAPM
jgi:hypothetical protein